MISADVALIGAVVLVVAVGRAVFLWGQHAVPSRPCVAPTPVASPYRRAEPVAEPVADVAVACLPVPRAAPRPVGPRAGVRVVLVDPRNTSRTCPECAHCAKGNRKSQAEFVCQSCGFADHADHVGAVNIARRGCVDHPIVWGVEAGSGDSHPIPRRAHGQSLGL